MIYLLLNTWITLPSIPGYWRALIIRNMVLIVYVLLIIQALLYALQSTLWSLLEVDFFIWQFYFTANQWLLATYYDCNYSLLIPCVPESLRYLSMYDNRCLRYFKGHKQRLDLDAFFSYMNFFPCGRKTRCFFLVAICLRQKIILISYCCIISFLFWDICGLWL